MTALPQAMMAGWLAMMFGTSLFLAVSRQKPFVIAFDRQQQTRICVGLAVGTAVEFGVLLVGGFWS